ncbi:hypothetical protein M7I_4188 [Glarea lozoyensis 74030]|uniref:Uncharacterized protein n=1 Tax=Glarea lozoyensis (strain ATCC 74030 / MF5533) TaxID=1104152 RepID=H0ENI4_GLAL7|nr:hypothetical protein M7I_4188 [Glarea lozoyensis 74030]
MAIDKIMRSCVSATSQSTVAFCSHRGGAAYDPRKRWLASQMIKINRESCVKLKVDNKDIASPSSGDRQQDPILSITPLENLVASQGNVLSILIDKANIWLTL